MDYFCWAFSALFLGRLLETALVAGAAVLVIAALRSRRRRVAMMSGAAALLCVELLARGTVFAAHRAYARSDAQARAVFAAVHPGMTLTEISKALPPGVSVGVMGRWVVYTFGNVGPCELFQGPPGFHVEVAGKERVRSAEWGMLAP